VLGTLAFPLGLHRFLEASNGKKAGFSRGYKSVAADNLGTAVLASC